VFGGGEVWQQTFAALSSKVSYADEATFPGQLAYVCFFDTTHRGKLII
jgi:hypothetical protein